MHMALDSYHYVAQLGSLRWVTRVTELSVMALHKSGRRSRPKQKHLHCGTAQLQLLSMTEEIDAAARTELKVEKESIAHCKTILQLGFQDNLLHSDGMEAITDSLR